MINLKLTENEKDLVKDVFIYMIDYINDECWTDEDRDTFDTTYSKLINTKTQG